MKSVEIIFWNTPEARRHNGGEYDFGIDINKRDDGLYELTFWTSSEFDFCSRCGHFHSEDCTRDKIVLDEKSIRMLIIEAVRWNAEVRINGHKFYDGEPTHSNTNFVPRFMQTVFSKIKEGAV